MATWLPLIAAPFAGSFLGVLIARLPQGRPVALARSACPHCHRRLGPAELVPLLSYAVQRGRCRGCGAPIGRFHPAVELAATAVAACAVAADGQPWWDCVLGWALLALAWIDWRHFSLPDALTLPLIPAGLLAACHTAPDTLGDHALGALTGYAAFRALALGYRVLRKREGLGHGDAKLLAAGGAWLGWQALPQVILLAALAGIALTLLRRPSGTRLSAATAVPFGPALALAIFALRLWMAQL